MSQQVGLLMIVTGTATFLILALKLLFQPFIPEDHYINDYFPSTELVLGVPILFGTVFFVGFGFWKVVLILVDIRQTVYNDNQKHPVPVP